MELHYSDHLNKESSYVLTDSVRDSEVSLSSEDSEIIPVIQDVISADEAMNGGNLNILFREQGSSSLNKFDQLEVDGLEPFLSFIKKRGFEVQVFS